MFSSTATTTSTHEDSIRVYKYRWVIIAIFFLYVAVNFFQTTQFTIISDVVLKYYEVDSLLIDFSALVFYVCYIPGFVPIGYLVEKTDKLGASSIPQFMNTKDPYCITKTDRYYLVMISQTVCALGQCFVIVLPSVTASNWFGAEQVSTGCALGLFGIQIGFALNMTIPFLTIKGSENKDIVTDQLNTPSFIMLQYV